MVRRHIFELQGASYFKHNPPIFLNMVHDTTISKEHRHDFVEICYVRQGKGFHFLSDETMPVEEGDAFLIPIGRSHLMRPSSAASNAHLKVINCLFPADLFSPERLKGFTESFLIPVPEAELAESLFAWKEVLHIKDKYGLIHARLAGMLTDFEKKRPFWQHTLVTGLIDLLIQFYRLQQESPEVVPAACSAALRCIRERAAEPLLLADAAKAAELSERQLQRLLKQYTGKSFKELLLEARIDLSCKLLKEEKLKVREAALRSGFQDVGYFHAAFKQITGMTPGRFRKAKSQA